MSTEGILCNHVKLRGSDLYNNSTQAFFHSRHFDLLEVCETQVWLCPSRIQPNRFRLGSCVNMSWTEVAQSQIVCNIWNLILFLMGVSCTRCIKMYTLMYLKCSLYKGWWNTVSPNEPPTKCFVRWRTEIGESLTLLLTSRNCQEP